MIFHLCSDKYSLSGDQRVIHRSRAVVAHTCKPSTLEVETGSDTVLCDGISAFPTEERERKEAAGSCTRF